MWCFYPAGAQREKPPAPNSNFFPQMLRTLDSFFRRPLSWLKETRVRRAGTAPDIWLLLACPRWQVLFSSVSGAVSSNPPLQQKRKVVPRGGVSQRAVIVCDFNKRSQNTPAPTHPPRALPTPGVKAGRIGFVE